MYLKVMREIRMVFETMRIDEIRYEEYGNEKL